MNLHKCILTENACYKAGKKITIKGIMLHSTGANNPNLKRYVAPNDGLLGKNQYNNHWNTYHPEGKEVCPHAFIGKLADGMIAAYQTLPWEHRGWHAGGSANNTHIGIEICEDDLTDYTYFKQVYQEAAQLCAYLCKEYGLSEQNILCHCEGYKKGIASNHSDVMHWFAKHGKSMDTFRAEVKALLKKGDEKDEPAQPVASFPEKLTTGYYRVRKAWNDSKSQIGAYRILFNAKAKADENTGYSVFDNDGNVVYAPSDTKVKTEAETVFEPYHVRVHITNLNIRKGPGTNYGKTDQFTGAGVFTIVAESDGTGASKWGKLKSGAGWISLDYATKL